MSFHRMHTRKIAEINKHGEIAQWVEEHHEEIPPPNGLQPGAILLITDRRGVHGGHIATFLYCARSVEDSTNPRIYYCACECGRKRYFHDRQFHPISEEQAQIVSEMKGLNTPW